MITQQFAISFAEEWITAWNSHNLERILPHCTDDFERSSPLPYTTCRGAYGASEGKAVVAIFGQGSWQTTYTAL